MAMTRVNRSRRCKICGKPDWCSIVDFPDGNIIHFCPRISGAVGDTVIGSDGDVYRLKTIKDSGAVINYGWESQAQYEASLAAWKAERKQSYGRRQPAPAPRVAAPSPVEERVVDGVAKILPPSDLDKFYRSFLSLLTLEEKHERKLLKEWGDIPGLMGDVKNAYPIKSLPPEDFVRFSSSEKLYNKSRKTIMDRLVETAGEPKGVPGFYQRKDGSWTFFRLAGIVFPMYNSHGEIIRLRVMDDYPLCHGQMEDVEGVFHYMRDDEQGTGWFFSPYLSDGKIDYDHRLIVYEHGAHMNVVDLDYKGFPAGSTPDGKYKNFTSFQEMTVKEVDGATRVVNRYANGCQSGSACSLYTKQGDDRTIVYCTEGEKKALVANMLLNVPAVSIPGVSGFGMLFQDEEGYSGSLLDTLRASGTELAVLAYDADKSQNEMVLRSEQSAVKRFIEKGMKIALGEWNANWGKGLDDILLKNVRPQITMVG